MTVFAAPPGYTAAVEHNWVPAARALALELNRTGRGSVIFAEAVGSLSGIKGRLNPIRDALDRTFLYASDIVINEGQAQPVQFVPGGSCASRTLLERSARFGSSRSRAARP